MGLVSGFDTIHNDQSPSLANIVIFELLQIVLKSDIMQCGRRIPKGVDTKQCVSGDTMP